MELNTFYEGVGLFAEHQLAASYHDPQFLWYIQLALKLSDQGESGPYEGLNRSQGVQNLELVAQC